MTEIKQFNEYGEVIETILKLKTSPLALKMIKNESEIPAGAIRPRRDRGYHLAQCQAFALSRREGLTIAMLKEDHWCWGALFGYGLVDPAVAEKFVETQSQSKILPRLDQGQYIGMVCAPLKTAGFVPDVILIYSNTAQLRKLLMPVNHLEHHLLASQFDPIDSCVYSVVPTFLTREFRITLPDPGEIERAKAEDCEIILSVPAEKMKAVVEGLKYMESFTLPKEITDVGMQPDFAQPDFYSRLFKAWGLEA